MEIRYLAGNVRRRPEGWSPEDDLERIRLIADLCHNMPGIARAARLAAVSPGRTRQQP